MNKVRYWIQGIWPVLLTAAIVIGLDQWTKELVRQNIPKFGQTEPIPALAPYFLFQHVDNYGAAFGMFQGGGLFFTTVAFIVSLGILFYATRLPLSNWWIRILLGMQMGGAIGNVVDRLNQGYVTDFIKMGIPGVYYWPNYNIADASIVCGVIGLAITIIIEDIREQRAQQQKQMAEPGVG
ncbi:MAG: signal peptidase II [Caldilineaceae bacterium]|nr:signal peptidase II [Caldilineaceae bacterium]MCB9137358.1 signal peptidase II [Caldilineaceae bacterium]